MIKKSYLRVKIIPRSPQNEIIGEIKNFLNSQNPLPLKIKIKAPPEKGKANAELIKFLSLKLNLPQENFSIVSGQTSRIKLLKISL